MAVISSMLKALSSTSKAQKPSRSELQFLTVLNDIHDLDQYSKYCELLRHSGYTSASYLTKNNFAASMGTSSVVDRANTTDAVADTDHIVVSDGETNHVVDDGSALDNDVAELIRFLFIKSQYSSVSPSSRVDLLWHQMLLMPRFYQQVCALITSTTSIASATHASEQLIEHDPLGGVDQAARLLRYEATKSHYSKLFPSGPLVAAMWPQQLLVTPTSLQRRSIAKLTSSASNASPNSTSATSATAATTAATVAVAVESKKRRLKTDDSAVIDEPIFLSIRDSTGDEMRFKVLKRTRFEKIASAVAYRKGIEVTSLKFSNDGKWVMLDDTIENLQLEDGDQIDVIFHMEGC